MILFLFLLTGWLHSFPLEQKLQTRPLPVGKVNRGYKDTSRINWIGTAARPLKVSVWYPSDKIGKEKILDIPNQFTETIKIFEDGTPLKSRKYPLIILSHGSMANADQMQWLAISLASKGYIVGAVNHNGHSEEEKQSGPLPLTEICMWESPKDISAVLDHMLADSIFGPMINFNQIGVAGFSLGGATAIWMAGPRFSNERLKNHSPSPPEFLVPHIEKHMSLFKTDTIVQRSYTRSENSFLDDRVKSVFALGPAIGQAFSPEELNRIKIPVAIVVGEKDLIAPAEMNAEYFAEHIKNSKLTIISGEGGHYIKELSTSIQAAELKKIGEIAFNFFEKTLK